MQELLQWFDENARDLPWRKTTPWGVVVSEFMLQQTPVNRVLPKWEEWMERWPTPAALAAAKRSDAISAWGRLGYPRRATRLHESAIKIVEDFGGKVPSSFEDLITLPGVGEYTAAAISAFAFGEKTLVLDVNIRRLFARALDGEDQPKPSISHIERALRRSLIPDDGAKWAAATMELGALICTARKPACDKCPIVERCQWRKNGYPTSGIPKRAQKWEGTDRQCRGKIVQLLRDKKRATLLELGELSESQEQINRCVKSLIADHLIEKAGNYFKLAD